MILSDRTLKGLLKSGELVIEPMEEPQVQPASIDFRLGDSFCVPKESKGVVRLDQPLTDFPFFKADSIVIQPLQFVLATTMEYFKLPDDLSAFAEGRSSVGRLGLFVENAGWVDPGFEGEITLELFNASPNPILLRKGIRVGQLVFAKLDQPCENPYRGKYLGQRGATSSKIHQDLENRNNK